MKTAAHARDRQPATPRPAPRLAAGALCVEFEWTGDRWRHRVLHAGAVLLESVEGPLHPDGDPRWPASPVLTEVSQVDAGGRMALVGVGLAGRSHFSASITADRERPETLVFELACRIQEGPSWLGSTYRMAGAVDAAARIPADAAPTGPLPRTVAWSYTIGPGGILRPAAGDRLGEPPNAVT